MRIFFYVFFLFIFGCSSSLNNSKKIYICGDHPCKDKKEINDYFDNNISVEVYTLVSDQDKRKNFDLVELNLLKEKFETKNKILVSNDKKGVEKLINERKRLAKLKIKEIDKSKTSNDIANIKEIKLKNKTTKMKKNKQYTFVRICKNLEECDINKISKIIMDIGKEKDYPDITN